MKKFLGIILGFLLIMAGCSFLTLQSVKEPCNRLVWFSNEVHDFACLGDNFIENGVVWTNVGEIINPELPQVLVIFWDNTGDCEADIANIYVFHKAIDKDNTAGLDVYVFNSSANVENVLEQIKVAHTNNPQAGHLDALRWLDCEPHSKKK